MDGQTQLWTLLVGKGKAIKMKSLVLYLVVSILLLSCGSDKRENSDSLLTYKDHPLVKFGLPYRELNVDNNSLIFYSMKSFDTSFLLQLKKEEKDITGVCYLVNPRYHRFVEDYLDSTNKLFVFQGFTFTMNLQDWDTVKRRINPALVQSDSLRNNEACLDCPHYILAYNHHVGNSSNRNREEFEKYEGLLKHHILNKLVKQKTPLLEK